MSEILNNPSGVASDLYLAFLARELAGEAVDFDALCRARPELAKELRALRDGVAQDDGVPNQIRAESDELSGMVDELGLATLLERMSRPSLRNARYRRSAEIGKGGTGRVFSAWDRDLSRALALKVLHSHGGSGSGSEPMQRVLRFVREAQITSQLDHPGIVPVHDLGIDDQGRPFFAMKLVRGRDLKSVYSSVWSGEDGWNLTRAITTLLKVCEAVAYAHNKGVVHRDLKPANIMVGRFGEVFVMDWGVAHVEEGESAADAQSSRMRPARLVAGLHITLTSEGSIVGTPPYMAPEQASGDTRLLGVWTDVYALGALIYHLLAKHAPYLGEGSHESTPSLIQRVSSGPPIPLAGLAPQAPAQLVSICERAMARNPAERYASVQALAEDLQAYVEGGVVKAYRASLGFEVLRRLRKHKALASALAVLAALGSVLAWAWNNSERIRLLNDLRTSGDLIQRFPTLWPASEEKRGAIEEWLKEAEDLEPKLEFYQSQLDRLRKRALTIQASDPAADALRSRSRRRAGNANRAIFQWVMDVPTLCLFGGLSSDGMTFQELVRELFFFVGKREEYLRAMNTVNRQSWSFHTAWDELLYQRLIQIMDDFDILFRGTLHVRILDEDYYQNSGFAQSARATLDAMNRVSVKTHEMEDAWKRTLDAIADRSISPRYSGLGTRKMPYLFPIGQDPESGLWEFAHVLTGEIPRRDAQGKLHITAASAVVLVLIPGGRTRTGSQNFAPEESAYDPFHERVESPAFDGKLFPFYISKYELTIAQWERLAGAKFTFDNLHSGGGLYPARGISWLEATSVLACTGLRLPTEAQWGHAARGETNGPWWTGDTAASLYGRANLLSHGVLRDGVEYEISESTWTNLDEYDRFAPVDCLAPNPNGLYHIHGNVDELCRDQGSVRYDWRNFVAGTLERVHNAQGVRVARGGSFQSDPREARIASRRLLGSGEQAHTTGLRPSIDPHLME